IAGTVADSSGRPLEGARLVLTGDGIGPNWAMTDARGRYRFPAIYPHHACSVTAGLGQHPLVGERTESIELGRHRARVVWIDGGEAIPSAGVGHGPVGADPVARENQ